MKSFVISKPQHQRSNPWPAFFVYRCQVARRILIGKVNAILEIHVLLLSFSSTTCRQRLYFDINEQRPMRLDQL
jgi:hypothetical protein